MTCRKRFHGRAGSGPLAAALTLLAFLAPACRVYPGGVYLSQGTVMVPNLQGLDSNGAAARLRNARLLPGQVLLTAGRRVHQVVVAQNPGAGVAVPAGSYVSYTLAPPGGPALAPEPLTVTVPSLLGLTLEQARGVLAGAGFALADTQWASSSAATGTVISQNPVGGSAVRPGSAVALVLSAGASVSRVAVPNVIGLPQAAAQLQLRRHGFVLGTVTHAHSLRVPAGAVVSQEPAAGSLAAEGDAVSLVVATLRPQRGVAVPNVTGMRKMEAARALTAAGLDLGSETVAQARGFAEGTVVRQDPSAGSIVPPGTAVNLVIAEHRQGRVVPQVTGLRLDAARAALQAAGLETGTVAEQVVVHGAGSVLSQNPAAGTPVHPRTPVHLVVGVAPAGVPVPAVAGLNLDHARGALERAGFVLGAVRKQDPGPGTIPNNTVLDQNPDGGALLARGGRVDLTIAWHEAQSVRVPSLRGHDYGDAIQKLADLGLRVGQVEHRQVARGQVGKVIDQSPSANTRVWEGTAVNLVVGVERAERLVLVPPCILLSEAKAVEVIQAKGLVPKVHKVTGIPRGRVIFQFPPPGTPVAEGTHVKIHVTK